MDAVIYGETPKANIEKLLSPPPLIILNISKNPKSSYICEAQGIVTEDPKANKPKQNNVR